MSLTHPIGGLSREDLDRTLGEPHDSATKIEEQREGKPEGASLVSEIHAGCDTDMEIKSNLDEFEMELETPSGQFSDEDVHFRASARVEEEEVKDRFIRTRSTRQKWAGTKYHALRLTTLQPPWIRS